MKLQFLSLLIFVAVVALILFRDAAPVIRRAAYVATYRIGVFLYGLRRSLGDAFMGYMFASGLALRVFQSTVFTNIGFGNVGEIAMDGPTRTRTGVIKAAVPANAVIGRWFTQDPADQQWTPGGENPVGGVLMFPKNYAATGANGIPLAASLVVPVGTVGEFEYMGTVIVQLAAAVNIGDPAKYDTTTGIISSGAPGAGEAAIPNSRFMTTNAAAGLAVLELTQ
jgi:hypothetical protein